MSRVSLISIVIPAYNEQEVLPLLLARLERLIPRLPSACEVLIVNDGSRDATGELLVAATQHYTWLKVAQLARNFGHEAATTVGTDLALGDVVVVMDADLQDPPELVLDMLAKFEEGYDVVYAQRTRRDGETWLKRVTAQAFYALMHKLLHRDMPENVSDFRLMSRAVVDAFAQLREEHRFVRGLIAWLGFKQTAVQFTRPARAAGVTKYSLLRLCGVAWEAITSFSSLPLRLAYYLAAVCALAGVVLLVYTCWQWLSMGAEPPIWSWLLAAQLLLSAVVLGVLGIVGDYVGRMYDELKGRPLYIVRELLNFPAGQRNERPRSVLPQDATNEGALAPHVFDRARVRKLG